jgi:hypothetical protein
MPLSRLDNFLKNARGNILYVNPNDLDSTDSIENQGNSLTRPFKTIQRALIEASRFSYQRGLDNDRFGQTTIMLYPGDHVVDNRPGWIPDGANSYRQRNGQVTSNFSQWDLTTNYDLTDPDNVLYKMNSINGGVILPRGTSIIGLDLRKTRIRPLYVPNPENDNIERSCIFRVTGSCYLWQFSILDADPNGTVYKDYTSNIFVPNFSHHKLSCFEYADGTNPVNISDTFQTYSTDRTDLDMYYEKVGLVYGPSSGREIEPDYPSSALDIQPKIDEYRIVGPTGGEVGITSIKAGDGSTSTSTITVTLADSLAGLDVDTAFRVNGITASGYDGQYVVSEIISSTEFQYQVQNAPLNPLPSVTGATVNLSVDTVTSASPYIFNISLRSVYGMCGLLADGDKASGFKSMVVAQFTGIGLQKDDNAFVKYDPTSGEYKDSTFAGNENIHSDSLAVFKPSYANFHIKAVNNSFLQLVSIFAIGYAEHFVAESGGDHSITNSNSNFGAKALIASGFRKEAFSRDDVGYITHIIPPKEIETLETSIEFLSIDVNSTIGAAQTNRLYLYNQNNIDNIPDSNLEGYRIAAKPNDSLNVLISEGGVSQQYSSRIIQPNTEYSGNEISYQKTFTVGRSVGINSITGNTLTLTNNHNFINGETIRVLSDNAQLPDGINFNTLYYAITDGVNPDQIKIAATFNDAINGQEISINDRGGILSIQSRVSDKNSGDIGHPIQFDSTINQWYINVASASTENSIYPTIVSLGATVLGQATPRTFINRRPDTRNLLDSIYRVRYVIPAASGITSARPPIDGYVIQESNNTLATTNTEVESYYSPTTVSITNSNQQRNFRIIADASYSGGVAEIITELPHNLSIGSQVEINNVKSSNNTEGTANLGYNGTHFVVGISSTKQFTYSLAENPGTFDKSQTVSRTTSLPTFSRKKYEGTYYVYRSQEIQKYVAGQQDGIYQLFVINSSNRPNVSPFTEQRFSQPIQYFYPQTNRDNPNSDPKSSVSFAVARPVGQVVIDDPQHSITKETLENELKDSGVGVGITDIVSTSGIAHTIYTTIDHGFNRITQVSIASSGAGYGYGSAGNIYNARLVGFAGSITGYNATARISVDASGGITDVKIMDGGSAYGIGNTLAVVGVATTTGYSQAVVTVDNIYNNVGDTIAISGVVPEENYGYNTLYRISGIPTGNSKQIEVESSETVVGYNTHPGIGVTNTLNTQVLLTGRTLGITSFTYENTTGIASVTTSDYHGVKVDNKIRIGGANSSLYNGDFIVKKVDHVNKKFDIYVGITTSYPSTAGTLYAYRPGFTANGGNVSIENENLSGRLVSSYAGITTTLTAAIADATTDEIQLDDIETLDLELGDFLLIDEEIVRIKETVSTGNVSNPPSNPIKVFRGILGTRPTSHVIKSVVRKIKCFPIELRRNSIIRASGHTFEYVGFGPGNYSTALPDRQDRQITAQEEILAQSTKLEGGINIYTAMNSDGDFYIGNKKVSSATGQEEVFDAPIPSVTGEDLGASGVNIGFDVLTPLEVSVSRSVRVEGGPDGTIISEFDGPVIFNNKITTTSEKGVETSSLYLQGNATVSRKYTVGISTPSLSGNPGDIEYNATPSKGGYGGWVYTTDNDWYRFGNVSIEKNSNVNVFDKVGIATTNPGNQLLKVEAGSTTLNVDTDGVGIGTTGNGIALNVIGIVSATQLYGDGSNLTNLPSDSLWVGVGAGGTGIYPKDLLNVGVGTDDPEYLLHVSGAGVTDLYVEGGSRFISTADFDSKLNVHGQLVSTDFDLNDSSSGSITAGIVTTNILRVGAGFTAIATTEDDRVGVGTLIPRAKFDIEGSAKFKTYSENIETVTISNQQVTVDLTKAQNFSLTVTSNVDKFILQNCPSGLTAFTLKLTQNGTGNYDVDLDTFRTIGDVTIPVYWPGGVLPIVTPTPGKTDVYSFITFDGGSSLYAVIGGQNFTLGASGSGGISTTSVLTTADYATTANYALVAGIATVASGLSGTANVNTTGIITASSFVGNGSGLTNVSALTANIATFATSAGSAVNATNATRSGYADVAGIATVATTTGYATTAGIATESIISSYASTAGIATYASVSGIATLAGYATSTGISSYSSFAFSAGISTISEGLFGIPNITVSNIDASAGIVTLGSSVTIGVGITDFIVNGYGYIREGLDVGQSLTANTINTSEVTGISTNLIIDGDGTQVSIGTNTTFTTGPGYGLVVFNTTHKENQLALVGGSAGQNSSRIHFYDFHPAGPNYSYLNVEGYGLKFGSTISAASNDLLEITSNGDLKVSGIVTSVSGIVTYYGDSSYTVDGRWEITNSGTSDYILSGIGITAGNNTDPILYLARGRVYEFKNTVPGSHPFEIRTSSGGAAYIPGISTYSDGSSVVTRFEIPFNAPNSLFYQCTVHASMGSTITIYPSI